MVSRIAGTLCCIPREYWPVRSEQTGEQNNDNNLARITPSTFTGQKNICLQDFKKMFFLHLLKIIGTHHHLGYSQYYTSNWIWNTLLEVYLVLRKFGYSSRKEFKNILHSKIFLIVFSEKIFKMESHKSLFHRLEENSKEEGLNERNFLQFSFFLFMYYKLAHTKVFFPSYIFKIMRICSFRYYTETFSSSSTIWNFFG